MSERFTPGQIFIKHGRFWRVRLKHERVGPEDYHVGHDWGRFEPNIYASRAREAHDSYNKEKFNHIHEVESYLIGEMLNAKARQEIEQ